MAELDVTVFRKQRATTRRIWGGMLARCYRPSTPHYADYGGRGITVCDAWRESFDAFVADMGMRPGVLWLDRIDNDGNYEPGNCRWATRNEQQQNKRTSLMLSLNGETHCLAVWARKIGIQEDTLRRRIKIGIPAHIALTVPVQGHPRNRLPR